MLEMFANDYMYLASVQFINSIKTASLSWHSPMLNDISAVRTWDKVNSGMIKMYKAEVLGKLPVVQHFLFGELLPFPEGVVDDENVEVDSHGHVHADAGWSMDCCGIPGGSDAYPNEGRLADTRGSPIRIRCRGRSQRRRCHAIIWTAAASWWLEANPFRLNVTRSVNDLTTPYENSAVPGCHAHPALNCRQDDMIAPT